MNDVAVPTLSNVPGMPDGETLTASPLSRDGRLFIIVPYEFPAQVDARALSAMKYLSIYGFRSAAA